MQVIYLLLISTAVSEGKNMISRRGLGFCIKYYRKSTLIGHLIISLFVTGTVGEKREKSVKMRR